METSAKDLQSVLAIFHQLGVDEFDPQVPQMLLDFVQKYVCEIVDDAKVYSNHANKTPELDVDDIKLSIQAKMNTSFTYAAPREMILEVANFKNMEPIPLPKKVIQRESTDEETFETEEDQVIPKRKRTPSSTNSN